MGPLVPVGAALYLHCQGGARTDFGSINWLAVVACVVVSLISSTLWYNPRTFFPVWWKGIGKKEGDVPGMAGAMGITWALTVLASLVQAVFMALAVNALGSPMGGPSLTIGARIGFLIWLGFIAPTTLVNKLFAGHGLKVWAIEAVNHLVNFVLFGAILGAWR